ncbi:MAG: pyruvate dehydrogenase (acetyl-transferring) E1 component subunit alpha [Phycisphaerales bacterium]|nr:pyruvate dehydrogenase (acetyl-transferring) E1 component subunit alpha [Phycisphaerales bacterium]
MALKTPNTTVAQTPTRPTVDVAVAQRWLREMMLIREFELRCMQAYQDKKIGGFCHVYIGQEAVAVGTIAAIEAGDPVVTAYRDHGHALARGMDAKHCMAEMFGRVGGCAKGKGGSMHMFDRANNLFGGHGIVGAQIPLGVGLAFATKYEDEVINGGKSKRVTLAFLGDGALNQGSVHEAQNLAGLFDLPVIVICENNGYSMGTSITRGTTMGHDISVKAAGYGIEAVVMNGMDVLDTYFAMKDLVERVRATSRPAFVDMRCYRYKGHSMSDPRKYRTREEEERYEADDPIGRLKAHLESRSALSEEEFKTMQRAVRQQVREAVEWAEQSPAPSLSDLYRDVYREKWGPYTGSSNPQMLGGAENPAGFAASDPEADLL